LGRQIKIKILENARPVAGFFEGFAGLAFAAGEDEPVCFWCEEAVEGGFGGAGVVLAGLARPEADFEAAFVAEPAHLVVEEIAFDDGVDDVLRGEGGLRGHMFLVFRVFP
jgi:hypothetical protein